MKLPPSSFQRPSYSINGILGIPQPADANANNINKRKREEDGERSYTIQCRVATFWEMDRLRNTMSGS